MFLAICLTIPTIIGGLFHLLFIELFGKNKFIQQWPSLQKKIVQALLNDELLSATKEKLVNNGTIETMLPHIETHIDAFLNVKLKEKMPAIAMFIGEKTIATMKATLMEEIALLMPQVLSQYASGVLQPQKLQQLIDSNTSDLNSGSKLWAMLLPLRKQIIMLGAISGFVIGLVMYAIIHFMPH
jgi:hypothetical protein